MKHSTAENFIRSAKPPTIRQQVIAAKVAWKARYSNSGSTTPLLKVPAVAKVPFIGSKMPCMKSRLVPPMKALPSVNAKL